MDAGWPQRGEAAARLFASARDHADLSGCIRELKALTRDREQGRDRGMER